MVRQIEGREPPQPASPHSGAHTPLSPQEAHLSQWQREQQLRQQQRQQQPQQQAPWRTVQQVRPSKAPKTIARKGSAKTFSRQKNVCMLVHIYFRKIICFFFSRLLLRRSRASESSPSSSIPPPPATASPARRSGNPSTNNNYSNNSNNTNSYNNSSSSKDGPWHPWVHTSSTTGMRGHSHGVSILKCVQQSSECRGSCRCSGPEWGATPPVQSQSFRVLQKITGTDRDGKRALVACLLCLLCTHWCKKQYQQKLDRKGKRQTSRISIGAHVSVVSATLLTFADN